MENQVEFDQLVGQIPPIVDLVFEHKQHIQGGQETIPVDALVYTGKSYGFPDNHAVCPKGRWLYSIFHFN